ncbi:MAG: hypothetical protein BGO97_02460 [Micrococcales bacterium 70-64]|nr:MAG: hypothetical protein ABT06_02465 [Leifsonia sp. SCN 70-46]OJX84688.1 MAG: hypothetical protein BGO97_02460 [Micrococcales bacterium 70-64]
MVSTLSDPQHSSVRRRGAVLVVLLAGLLLALASAPQAAQAAPFAVTTAPGTLFSGAVTVSGAKDAAATVTVSVQGGGPGCTGADADPEKWTCDVTGLTSGSYTLDITDGTTTTTLPVRVLTAPVITTTGVTAGTLNGTGYPGAGIELTGDFTKSCGVVPSNGAWSCALGVGSGTYHLVATQTWGNVSSERGGSTASTPVVVDAIPPAVPAFLAPAAGSRVVGQPTVFSGTGETGARVEVYVDSVRVCVAPVSSGSWSCSAALSDGTRVVQGIQYDIAGNSSGTSAAYSITAGPAPVTPAEPPSRPNPNPAPVPATPLPTSAPVANAPFLPPPVGGTSGLPPFETWELPTDYGAAIPSVSATNPTSWLLGLALGLGFAVLVALPLRLLVSTFRRKRGYAVAEPRPEEPALLSPRVTAVLFLAAAVLLAALAGGVQAEVRYLRLAIAIGLALTALNGVAVLAAKLMARTGLMGAAGTATGIRLAPLLLAVAAVTALVSRVAGIQPPIVVGIVLAVRFAPEVAARARGIVSLVQVAAIVLLGFVAWIGQSALGPVDGFLPSLVSETLAALTIAALGSAMVMLLPVSRMPGRLIYSWSRTAWVAVTLVTATVAGVVIAGGSGFPVPWVIGGALVFAAVSVGAWAYVHLIEPHVPVRGQS